MNLESLDKITVGDLKLLSQLPLYRSVNSLASNLNVESGNLSRRLARLEEILEVKLLSKTRRGYELGENAQHIIQRIVDALGLLETIPSMEAGAAQPTVRRLRLVGRGFLVDWLIACCLKDMSQKDPSLHFDWMDCSPEAAEHWARDELVDIILSLGDVTPGEDWHSESVGKVSWVYIARKGHPLAITDGALISEELRKFPFIGFSYVEGGVFYRRPAPAGLTVSGIEGCHSQSSRMTVLIVNSSEQIGIVPDLSLQAWPEANRPEILRFGPTPREQILHVHAHKDRVRSAEFKLICSVAKAVLSDG